MKPGALILGIVVSVALLAVAGGLYTLSGTPGAQHYRAAVDQVRRIEQLSAGWSIEVARVRTDPLADFDSLAAFLPQMARLKESLADVSRRIPDLPDRLANEVNAFLSAMDAKEERIEQFKSGYAVVRNSARYLPLAAANVTRRAQEVNDLQLQQSISTLTQDMNLYLATPSGPRKERLDAEVETLREASVGYPPELANGLANLLAHVDVLLARQAPTDELFQQATSNDIAGLASRLIGALEFELARLDTRTSRYEDGMLAVIGVLAVFWIGLAIHQRTRVGEAAEPAPHLLSDLYPASAGEAHLRSPLAAAHREVPGGLHAPRRPDSAPGDAPVFASRPGMSAEAAMLYRYRAERVGENIAGSAGRVAARVDHLHRSLQSIRHALQGSEYLPGLPDGAEIDDEIEASVTIASHLRREVNGIANLARRLASYSPLPDGDAERDMVDVNTCIEQVIAALGASDTATVTTRLGPVPEIFASRIELRLLLTQIIENSVRAVEELKDKSATIKIETAPRNDKIVVTVIDNGGGIEPDRRTRIFAPFYTSRDGAIGLGLTLAGHLVKKYEGAIKVNSLPGQGTVTRITLPTGTPSP